VGAIATFLVLRPVSQRALALTALHYLLTIGLGRGGLIVSLLVLAVQLTSTGGLYPARARPGTERR
jgi:hypothetical protein